MMSNVNNIIHHTIKHILSNSWKQGTTIFAIAIVVLFEMMLIVFFQFDKQSLSHKY